MRAEAMRAGSAWHPVGMDRLDVRFWHEADQVGVAGVRSANDP